MSDPKDDAELVATILNKILERLETLESRVDDVFTVLTEGERDPLREGFGRIHQEARERRGR